MKTAFPHYTNEADRRAFLDAWLEDRAHVWDDLKQAGNLHPTLSEYFEQGETRSAAFVAQWVAAHPIPEPTPEPQKDEPTPEPQEEEPTAEAPQVPTVEDVAPVAEPAAPTPEPQPEAQAVAVLPVSTAEDVAPVERKPRKQRKPRVRKSEAQQLDLFEQIAPEPTMTTGQKIVHALAVVVAVVDAVVKVAAAVACAFILLLTGSRP